MVEWVAELARKVKLIVTVLGFKIFLRMGTQWTSSKRIHAANSSRGWITTQLSCVPMPVVKYMIIKSASELTKPSEDYAVIRQPGRTIAERSIGHLHSEEYKPMAQVMKRMVDIYKENEGTLSCNTWFQIQASFHHIVFQEEHGRECSVQEPSRRAYASPAPSMVRMNKTSRFTYAARLKRYTRYELRYYCQQHTHTA